MEAQDVIFGLLMGLLEPRTTRSSKKREIDQEKGGDNVVIEEDENVDNVGADVDPEHCPSL